MKRLILGAMVIAIIAGLSPVQAQQPSRDSVDVSPGSACCFSFALKNRNQSKSPIDGFDIIVQTAGVEVSFNPAPTAPKGWGVFSVKIDSARFRVPVGSIGIRAGQVASPFTVCFNNSVGTFTLKWISWYKGQQVSTATIQVSCPVNCDDVSAFSLGNCCFDWHVTNNNSLKRPINDFHLQIITPGVTVTSTTPASGWNITGGGTPGSTRIDYQASPTGAGVIPPGQGTKGFLTCFEVPAGGTSAVPFKVIWITTYQGQTICMDTVLLRCMPPPPTGCDEVDVKLNDDCCFDFFVKNKNANKQVVNDFHLDILTPGITFRPTPGAPAGWTGSVTGSTLSYVTTGGGIAAGDVLSGFKPCFDFAGGTSIPFQVAWRTTAGGKTICSDTIEVQCSVDAACDTAQFTLNNVGNCCYDVVLKNRHTPYSALNDFHIKILTPGATFTGGSVSGPWVLTAPSNTEANFNIAAAALPSGQDQPGFRFCVDRAIGTGDLVSVYWESTLNSKVICSGIEALDCGASDLKCDTIAPRNLDKCCYDFEVRNRHTPLSVITDFHLGVITPGVTIRPTPLAPGGWSMVWTPTSVDYHDPTFNGIPSAGSKNGFVVCFDHIPASGVVTLYWCTTNEDKTICCDTISIQCEPTAQQCDAVTPNLIDDAKCCWDFQVLNQHTPTSNINDFHIRILTPGVTITSANKPINWTVATPGGTQANYLTTAPGIATASSLTGFVLCFDTKQIKNGPFKIVWETTNNQQTICIDTITMQCPTVDAIRVPGSVPAEFALLQNFPNPFNPTTIIPFDISAEANVDLTIFDDAGRLRVTVVKERLTPGHYQIPFDASDFPSGTYYYRLSAGGATITRTMVLVK